MNGFTILAKVFHLFVEQKTCCVIPLKSIVTCCNTWKLACLDHSENTVHVLKDNHLSVLSDILQNRLCLLVPKPQNDDGADDGNEDYCPVIQSDGPQTDAVALAILSLLDQTCKGLAKVMKEEEGKAVAGKKPPPPPEHTLSRAQDQISYIVSLGTIDSLAEYLQNVQDPIDGKPEVGEMILACLNFMSSLATMEETIKTSTAAGGAVDHSHMLQAYKMTELAGIVSMLYGALLHQGAPTRDSYGSTESDSAAPPPPLPKYVAHVAISALLLLKSLAKQDLSGVQDVMAQEGISLEFRHIASYLLWFCCQQLNHAEQQQQQPRRGGDELADVKTARELFHTTITLVGYFAAGHEENQVTLNFDPPYSVCNQPSFLSRSCNLATNRPFCSNCAICPSRTSPSPSCAPCCSPPWWPPATTTRRTAPSSVRR